MSEWFENEEFWRLTAPYMFSEPRWERAVEEVEATLKLMELSPGVPVLDLCCGVGRHSLEFARRGYRVTGVDRNAQFLAEARRRAADEGLEVEFVEEDMRRFCRPESFDGALNYFTSFGYFEDREDDKRVLRNLFESLRPGGKLVMDLLGKEKLARVFQERRWHRCEDGTLLLEEAKLADDWGVVGGRWILVKNGERKEFTHRIRLYSAAELKAVLRDVGFDSVRCFGNLELDPYDHTAQRLLVLATKA